ncbi:MAG: ArsR family transcriptional regulator, partial [Vogesella sp.]|nr:ArsR family transcriptional regulator [Vogesella sp.]
EAERHAQARMNEMYQLIELVTKWFADIRDMDVETLEKLMKLGSQVGKVLQFTQSLGRLAGRDSGKED